MRGAAGYEARERARKVGEIREAVPEASAAEAEAALQQCGGDEQEAVTKLVDGRRAAAAWRQGAHEEVGAQPPYPAPRPPAPAPRAPAAASPGAAEAGG